MPASRRALQNRPARCRPALRSALGKTAGDAKPSRELMPFPEFVAHAFRGVCVPTNCVGKAGILPFCGFAPSAFLSWAKRRRAHSVFLRAVLRSTTPRAPYGIPAQEDSAPGGALYCPALVFRHAVLCREAAHIRKPEECRLAHREASSGIDHASFCCPCVLRNARPFPRSVAARK